MAKELAGRRSSSLSACVGRARLLEGLRAVWLDQDEEMWYNFEKMIFRDIRRRDQLEITPHHLVEGVVHRYDPSEHEHEEWVKVKHVPLARVVVCFEGCWRDVVRWHPAAPASRRITPPSGGKVAHSMEWTTVTGPTPLQAVPKMQVVEQRQRDEAADWRRRGVEYFEKDIQSGVPTLTQAGREALEAEIKYEHEDENEDGVERDNGSAPAS
ncbi:hypothetical protein EDB92DRAFT_1951694 [Lactarius akahatsu]|uniref:Uncharacterized protein n=1 Tax=Lactarius akahatsu TaxID=416441 RepID=A0AAD4Q9J1_9AGAM|nr:hypothetical protein EDB92DRAFT_1951694 [Lactarius akahatsu]